MIVFTRLLAKQIRSIFCRALNLSPSALNQPVKLSAGSFGLKITSSYGDFAVEHEDRKPRPKKESLIVPLQLLKEVEGGTPDEVTIRREGDQVIASWQEGAVPKIWSTPQLEESDRCTAPAYAEQYGSNDIRLLESLDTATLAIDPNSARYALGCLQLRGTMGDITTSDGHQVIRESGFKFGFDDEVLVRPSKVFEAKDLRKYEQVEIGRTKQHLVLIVGPWTFWCPRENEGRFPRVDDVIPRTNSATAVLEISDTDAKFLKANLPHLPGAADQYKPVTLDLNGAVALRAQEHTNQPITELVLSNSKATGRHVFAATNRQFVERALDLGFRKFHFFGDNSPVSCVSPERSFVWMLLGKENTVARNHAKTNSITSPFQTSTRRDTVPKRPSIVQPTSPAAATPVSTAPATTPVKRRRRVPGAGNIIDQAMALRTTLREVYAQTAELVRSIKKQRKHDRVLRTTLASLKQLHHVA